MNIHPLPTDKETVLVLAGDIGLVDQPSVLKEYYIPFLTDCSMRFRAVILIMGNHEHYNGSFVRTIPKMRQFIHNAYLGNVYLLEKEVQVIDDVAFIGTTLWTDCDKHNPMAPMLWNSMTDSKKVRTGPNTLPYDRRFLAQDTWVEFRYSKKFIFEAIDEQKALGRRTVVVTHHGPTYKSISPGFEGDALNMFYVSDMALDIMDHPPELWIHGHTHHAHDYFVDGSQQICQTRVICNPRGYVGYEGDHGFNPTLVVDV
jgi:hypothetical protein